MAARLIDERTEKPIAYKALLAEADKLAGGEGMATPATCRQVAELAHPDAPDSDVLDSIEHRLRGLRRERARAESARRVASGPPPPPPPPGFGVLFRDLGTRAKNLEDEQHTMAETQTFNTHRVKLIHREASAIYAIAEQRDAELKAVSQEQARDLLRPFLHGVGDVNPSLDPQSFIDAERRQVEVILRVCSRVLIDAEGTIGFLDRTPGDVR